MPPIILGIDRADVERCEVHPYITAIEAFSSSAADAQRMMGNVMLAISGYDDDPRALWQIAEAREWFKELDRELPHLLFFLSPEAKAVKLYFFMVCELDDLWGATIVQSEVMAKKLTSCFGEMNAYCRRMHIPNPSPEMIEFTRRIVDSLH